MGRTKPIRVPKEFESFVKNLSNDFHRQTGLPPNNIATMRRLATWGDGKIITKGAGFDIILLGKKKKI